MNTLLFASDHAGYDLKKYLIRQYSEKYTVHDYGCDSAERCDYPHYAHRLTKEFHNYSKPVGVLVCGTGLGMAMAANKHSNIRAAPCHSLFTAQATRQHNNANILCLGARIVDDFKLAEEILQVFLKTEFEGGRHLDRVKAIDF